MKYFDNHFLFSETYIKEYIKEENKKKNIVNDDIESAFKQIKDWNHEYVSGEYAKDPWFEYIDSILDVLGFIKTSKNENRVIYANTISEGEKPVAVCHFIGKDEMVGSTRKGKYYSYNALKAAKEYGVNWAMLTNGYQWRIYNTKNVSPYENYLEVDIQESINNNTLADDAFKLFYLFFNVRTYYQKDGERAIEKIKELSDKKAETIEETLRGKAEEILKELCYGLKENMNKEDFTEKEKKAIYNDAIIILYRLLFFGYAESRGLLPIIENDPEYTDSYKHLCDDAKDLHNNGEVYSTKDGFEIWQRLDEQLRVYVDRSYNGGLFHNEDKPILKKHRIANGRLTKCLAELSYNLDKAGKYTEAIEYKDLSVRNLGSIYEGLLEYQLFIADERMVQRKSKGQVKYLRAAEVKLQNSDLKNIIEKGGIYLSQDALERKETGAYYTPEDVVEYIVENTVGKKLQELKIELFESKKDLLEQLSYEPVVSRQRALQLQIDKITMDFINEKILSLSIIDSAMGSGHFLVNAAYLVANKILEMIAENAWESDEDIIADIQHWKRKIVENCIYGIDINGLSVALARLSLWLISASNDKALSFIDHHLKEGNSIIGTDRRRVEIKGSKDNLFGVLSYEDYMRPILEKYKDLKMVGSATKVDVVRQKDIYDQINEDLKLAKKKYDYYLATQFAGGIEDQLAYFDLLSSKDIRDFEKKEMEPLWEIAEEKNFFHWELEFSEVFQKGGFDIAIGNPPYVQVLNEAYKHSIFKSLDTNNLYSYMIESDLNSLRNQGSYGFIIPISSISGSNFNSLQKFIIKMSSELYIDSFAKRPSKIFNKVEQRLAIIYGTRKRDFNQECRVFTCGHKRWYGHERKDLFKPNKYAECKYFNFRKGTIAKVSNKIENNIIEKIFIKSSGKIFKDYYSANKQKSSSFLIFHSTSGYWIKALNYMPNFYSERNGNVPSTKYKTIFFKESVDPVLFISILNSSIFYWYWILFSDERDLTRREINGFPINYESVDTKSMQKLKELSEDLMVSYKVNAEEKIVNLGGNVGIVRFPEFHPKYSKGIIDKIDDLLGQIYGLSGEEIDFIKNYDIRFRMGKESNEDE